MTAAQLSPEADLFTRRPGLTGKASATQPEPQRGPDQDASQRTRDIAPASPAVETADPGRWIERPTGQGGKLQRWWMPTLRPGGRRWFKQTGKTALERAEAKRQAQAEEDSRREKTAKEGKTA